MRIRSMILLGALLGTSAHAGPAWKGPLLATVPSGFVDTRVVNGLSMPTAFDFGPGGRIFVTEKGGSGGIQTAHLRLIKNGVLQATPFLSLSVTTDGERGLLGVALDPNYATNRSLYVYYCSSDTQHNYLSKFVADATLDVRNTSIPEQILLTAPTGAIYHNGGHVSVGPDGKLYLGVGDSHSSGAQSQDMTVPGGKINRINTDGSIPADNPTTFQSLGGSLPSPSSVWCCGLRNPFSHAWQQTTGRFFINDVGQDTWEEINDGIKGRNYGWTGGTSDGFQHNPSYTDPLFAYKHGGDAGNGNPLSGNVITGGAFYSGVSSTAPYRFPAAYIDHYFFADNGAGWISNMDLSNMSIPNNAAGGNFAAGISGPVDLHVGSDGALYYLAINSGEVRMITYGPISAPPVITQQPSNQTVTEGSTATFSVTATGTGTLNYQWQSMPPGGAFANIAGATGTTYTTPATNVGMNGTQYRVVVTSTLGSATSNAATLTVNYASPAITQQPQSQSVAAPSMATFSVTATGSGLSYQWQSMPPGGTFTNIAGATSASYTTPATSTAMNGTQYRVVIDNPAPGTVTSASATLTVTGASVAPSITTPPSSVTVTAPAAATFTVTATGTAPLGYQWQSMPPGGAFANITGATSSSYTTPATSTAMSGTQYRVTVTNSVGSVTSASATLTVNGAPVATPIIEPGGGSYSGPVTVRISDATPGATIHFTTDNSAPTSSSAVYTGPFVVSASETVRAIGVMSGMSNSAQGSAIFTLTGSTPYGLPYRDPPSGLNIPTVDTALPATLSATMLFQNPVSAMNPSPGLIPYGVNDPLWSDGAVKKRWIALPGNSRIGFAPTGEWTFPTGTILVKHFDLPIDDTNPSITKRLETRVFYIDPSGTSYGATYKWRADNSDADLLTNASAPLDEVEIITTATGTRTQTWSYPSRADCMNCHNLAAGTVLGPKTRQLNGPYTYPGGVTDNQLRTWNYLGMFASTLSEAAIPGYSQLVAVNDVNATLEDRVRSYLDSNCGQCHRPGGPSSPAAWDGRYDTPLASTNIVNGSIFSMTLGLANPKVVAPGDTADSVLLQRMLATTAPTRMPRIASHVVDVDATITITAWINSLPPSGGGGGTGGGGGGGTGGGTGGTSGSGGTPSSSQYKAWGGGCGLSGLEVLLALGALRLLRRRR